MADAYDPAARFVAALHEATRGRPNTFRAIHDVADCVGIRDGAEIKLAWKTAETAELIVVQTGHSAILTEKGRRTSR